jgi:protein-L-isoaspartate(D-aspartate) O-methyltransferase
MLRTFYYLLLVHALFVNCSGTTRNTEMPGKGNQPDSTAWWISRADVMVESQIVRRGVRDADVIRVMKNTPRHEFIPAHLRDHAYDDRPLPIGSGQTISQPYIVALMTEYLQLTGSETVLEIGTGSGYQAAVLAPLVDTCYSIEVVKSLAIEASHKLAVMDYDNIIVKWGDGYKGWPEHAPFDRIIITAAPPEIPEKLVEQLAVGGRMVLPVGSHFQELILITRTKKGIHRKSILPVRFVPMVHPSNPIPDK